MSSSRLPGKSLRPIAGKPMIAHVIERARITGPEVVLATTTLGRDDLLAEEAEARGVRVIRGDPYDVLDRYVQAAHEMQADAVVRLTGDCPFLDPVVSKRVIEAFTHCQSDYVSNVGTENGYPDGLDTEVFSVAALRYATRATTDRRHREHVTSFLRESPTITRGDQSYDGEDMSAIKLSVDSPQDMYRARAIMAHIPLGCYDMAATLQAVWDTRREDTTVWQSDHRHRLACRETPSTQ